MAYVKYQIQCIVILSNYYIIVYFLELTSTWRRCPTFVFASFGTLLFTRGHIVIVHAARLKAAGGSGSSHSVCRSITSRDAKRSSRNHETLNAIISYN